MKPTDPLDNIDPALREFLKKEAPNQYKPANSQYTPSTPAEPETYRAQLGLNTTNDPEAQALAAAQPQTQEDAPRPLPRESLFQDGRYAHLWSTYRPAAERDEAAKSDQEKLLDIVQGYKERQAGVGRAALENCADEQWAIHQCFSNGGAKTRMNMCREENRALERCVVVQSKFLRALGYLATYERTKAESEVIQMHADKLYHQMLEEEQATKEAKEKGLEPPKFEPLVKPRMENLVADVVPVVVTKVTFDDLPAEVQKKFMEGKFKGLDGMMLELAKREMEQELATNQVVTAQLEERLRAERQDRMRRREEGKERIGDKVKRWFDMRDYGDDKPVPPVPAKEAEKK